MPNPNWALGRTGQVYAKVEASYGTAPVFSAADAFRHLSIALPYNPKSPARSPERHTHPSQMVMLNRRVTAAFDLKAQLYPSGALNSLPEANVFLENGFGSKTNITIDGTVLTAASAPAEAAPTSTAFVITDIGLLSVGDFVQITLTAGATAGVYIRRLMSIAAAAGVAPKKLITVSPALPAAPVLGDHVKGCISYKLATALPASIDLAHYPQAPSANSPKREQLGCVVDKLSFQFDSNSEPMLNISGPAQGWSAAAQAQPGGFTTIGAENDIPSGLTGYFYYGGTLYQIEKMQVEINNAMDLQNTALGTSLATAFFRKGKRSVTVKVNAKVSDDLTIWTPSLTAASGELFIQLGTAAGKMWGLYVPAGKQIVVPDTPDSDETNNWDFSFECLGSSSSGNDEVSLALA